LLEEGWRWGGVKGTQQYMYMITVSQTDIIFMSPIFWDVLLGDWFRDYYFASKCRTPITRDAASYRRRTETSTALLRRPENTLHNAAYTRFPKIT
jgi:hypothetical protein